MLRCATDVGPEVNTGRRDYGGDAFASTNYVASNGGARWEQGEAMTGMFGRNSHVRFQDVTDGTSNTIMAGERAWAIGSEVEGQCRAASVFAVSEVCGLLTESDVMANGLFGVNQVAREEVQYIVPPVTAPRAVCHESFASLHAGGTQFVLADGSVRFISENIQRDHTGGNGDFVFQNLLNRNDGFTIGEY